MDPLSAFFKLIDQLGLRDALLVVFVVAAIWAGRLILIRWNTVTTMDAEARNRQGNIGADSIKTLVEGLNNMAASSNNVVNAVMTDMTESRKQRDKQSEVMTSLLGEVRGIALSQSDGAKREKTLSNTLNEVADRIGPIQTDLRDMSVRTAEMPSKLSALLDERFGPLLTLMMNTNTQTNAVAAALQINGQNVEVLIAELAKSNELTARVVSEFALWKDILFDKDDRFYDVLTKLLPTEKEKTP